MGALKLQYNVMAIEIVQLSSNNNNNYARLYK